MVILVLGNLKAMSITDILVLNLAVADLLFTGGLPFWAIERFLGGVWKFGPFMCKFVSFTFLLNLFASVYFLTALSIDRYICICHPIRSKRIRSKKYAAVLAVITWLVSPFFLPQLSNIEYCATVLMLLSRYIRMKWTLIISVCGVFETLKNRDTFSLRKYFSDFSALLWLS